jgi:hypothetical protein
MFICSFHCFAAADRFAPEGRPVDTFPAQPSDGRVRVGPNRRDSLPSLGDWTSVRRSVPGRSQPVVDPRQGFG